MPVRWFGTTCASFSNQKSHIWLSTLPLPGNRLAHHDVESRQAVGGDDQDLVVADRIVVADLAAAEQRQGGDAWIRKDGSHRGIRYK